MKREFKYTITIDDGMLGGEPFVYEMETNRGNISARTLAETIALILDAEITKAPTE